MQLEKVNVLLSMAEEMYNAAKEESMRSHEDVVTHLICYNSRQAVINYLESYLLINNQEPATPKTMEAMMKQCRDLDARFDFADITNIDCRFETHDKDYCLENNKVEGCFTSADQVRNIVLEAAPGY